MTQENLNPSEVMKIHTIQRLLTGAKEHLDRTDRRAQLGAFTLIWTAQEDNSIADLCENKNLN